jgi:hydroxymethylpyrimidine/phosphomethylpyrimidine kinase
LGEITERPFVLSIAGFDPSGGAGVLADVKTMEQHQVLGFGITTSITYQTEDKFIGLHWLENSILINQLKPLLEQYSITCIKIGLIQYQQLIELVKIIPAKMPIIWDPILSASAGFDFSNNLNKNTLKEILPRIHLITPNLDEYITLDLENSSACNVLLKGGHQKKHRNDALILTNKNRILIEGEEFSKPYSKHGTGCILSAAIASNIALGNSLENSCTLAKHYVEKILKSNDGLLGFHS